MKLRAVRLAAAFTLALGVGQSVSVVGVESSQPLFFIPAETAAVPEVIAAVNSARSSIHMIMFRISENTVADALIAAHKRGVEVNIIVDKVSAEREKPTGAYFRLRDSGMNIVKSSSAFTLSHIKAFVVDNQTAYIMTLNLTSIADKARDVGYITNDPRTVQFFGDLYATDLQNAANNTKNSPPSIPANIVLSPVNARERLVNLIATARKSIMLTVENFSDTTIMNALIDAQKRGVKVQALMPRCDLTENDFDMPAARTLSGGGVAVAMMPEPAGKEFPYIHQKSIVVDENAAFIGSENFTFNSLDKGRELGIIFTDAPQVRQLVDQYHSDFGKSLNLKAAETYKCPERKF